MNEQRTPLPLLIAPLQRRPLPAKVAAMFASDYTLGWLCKTETGYGWVTWGLLPKERALQAAQETLREHGPRELLIWDLPLTKELTDDQVVVIRAAQSETED